MSITRVGKAPLAENHVTGGTPDVVVHFSQGQHGTLACQLAMGQAHHAPADVLERVDGLDDAIDIVDHDARGFFASRQPELNRLLPFGTGHRLVAQTHGDFAFLLLFQQRDALQLIQDADGTQFPHHLLALFEPLNGATFTLHPAIASFGLVGLGHIGFFLRTTTDTTAVATVMLLSPFITAGGRFFLASSTIVEPMVEHVGLQCGLQFLQMHRPHRQRAALGAAPQHTILVGTYLSFAAALAAAERAVDQRVDALLMRFVPPAVDSLKAPLGQGQTAHLSADKARPQDIAARKRHHHAGDLLREGAVGKRR